MTTTPSAPPLLPPPFLRKSDRVWIGKTPYSLSLRTGWVYLLAEDDCSDGTTVAMPHPVLTEHLAAGLARIEHRN
jgi:hypothetical protein